MQLAHDLAPASPWTRVIGRAATVEHPVRKARALLDAVLAEPDLVLALPLARTPGRYERNYLFGDPTMSVWAMTWAPGSATSIHDHHCSCCFGIVAGELRERRFRPVRDDAVTPTREWVRGPGFRACLVPTGPNIHQMVNTAEVEAISVHVYGFDRTRRASSVEREYRLAAES
ncbi:MAG TPA: cysteine dioxygenase family protein [Microvirga sp.]|jgi:predicted metal-dependent enzyme (double-stranded beta helix superfamily)|nr:cysteine dioxygenase family protein [Microvirga sp.]